MNPMGNWMVQAMRIAIVTNYKKNHAAFCTKELSDRLRLKHCDVQLSEYRYQLNSNDKNLLETSDFIIAVGGDGTIIHTAKAAAQYRKPVLGVNAGKLGFTAGLESDELDLIGNLLQGDYEIQKRYMLSAEVIGGDGTKSYDALNDAVVAGMYSKIIRYQMAVAGKEDYRYKADGFIISTPTGSTAYSLSAGGPVIEPTMKCMTYTPICPHSLFNRSVIFDKDTALYVKIDGESGQVHLTVDGAAPIPVTGADQLRFCASDRYAQLIRLNKRNFYDVLYEKILDESNG